MKRYGFVLSRGHCASMERGHALLVSSMVYSDCKSWRGSIQKEVSFENMTTRTRKCQHEMDSNGFAL